MADGKDDKKLILPGKDSDVLGPVRYDSSGRPLVLFSMARLRVFIEGLAQTWEHIYQEVGPQDEIFIGVDEAADMFQLVLLYLGCTAKPLAQAVPGMRRDLPRVFADMVSGLDRLLREQPNPLGNQPPKDTIQ